VFPGRQVRLASTAKPITPFSGLVSIDLDSTVFQRSGDPEGAKRSYSPSCPGRNSHHPLIAFLAEALLTFLEARGIPYILVARLTQKVERKAAGLATWTPCNRLEQLRRSGTRAGAPDETSRAKPCAA
jgi:hypothetical protein